MFGISIYLYNAFAPDRLGCLDCLDFLVSVVIGIMTRDLRLAVIARSAICWSAVAVSHLSVDDGQFAPILLLVQDQKDRVLGQVKNR